MDLEDGKIRKAGGGRLERGRRGCDQHGLNSVVSAKSPPCGKSHQQEPEAPPRLETLPHPGRPRQTEPPAHPRPAPPGRLRKVPRKQTAAAVAGIMHACKLSATAHGPCVHARLSPAPSRCTEQPESDPPPRLWAVRSPHTCPGDLMAWSQRTTHTVISSGHKSQKPTYVPWCVVCLGGWGDCGCNRVT